MTRAAKGKLPKAVDRCRIYKIGDMEMRVRGSRPMSKEGIAAFTRLIEAVREHMKKLPSRASRKRRKK